MGLVHPGGVAGFTSEWWPASVRNGGRLQIGIPAGINSEYLAGMRRNLQPSASSPWHWAPVTASRASATAPYCCWTSQAPSAVPELVALDCEDLEECETGLRIAIRHSKTDQEGAGTTIAVVRGSIACPVGALKAWRDGAGITSGALFRSVRKGGKVGERLTAQSVADIVKDHAEAGGLDPHCSQVTACGLAS